MCRMSTGCLNPEDVGGCVPGVLTTFFLTIVRRGMHNCAEYDLDKQVNKYVRFVNSILSMNKSLYWNC